jgi:hypothetical protein
MNEFVNFLGFINQQLNSKGIQRFESMLMPANFSSMVGEFINTTLPKHCVTLAKNLYHNGHPDLVPKGQFPGDSLQHGTEGIEIKASRYGRGCGSSRYPSKRGRCRQKKSQNRALSLAV